MQDKEERERVAISPHATVTVTKAGNVVEVQHMAKMNNTATIKKIDNDTYIDLSTGEIKEFNKAENKSESYVSLTKTFKRLRYLINNNFQGNSNELHITLTYAENMTDNKKLYTDFDKFMKKIKYKYRQQSTVDYISVIEPQERGAWHVHCLIRFNDLDSIFIPSNDIAKTWGHGFVTVRALKHVDNIGAYLSAYLADIELTEKTVSLAFRNQLEVTEKHTEGKDKKFIKGGRLHYYPSNMQLYRSSKGIKMPDRERMKYKDAKKVVGSREPNYSRRYEVQTDDFENTIQFEQYNLKR